MSDIVIRAENLGKKYTIGHQAENGKYTALRDVLAQNARTLWHKTRDLVQGKPLILGDTLEEVWALQDVNFAIQRGEAVGIIGRNGAGKSTLLKILSRITEPSVGRVTIKGRVASLLEVGTGFHPELSGRENVYLNGAILGMTRREIKRKFDEIVAFAEVEKHLDTPVKRYSSGMYVRLAFAVAAHLEPEILVVDEVLAVGDAAFQKKCLGKMGDVASEGRTVLFVSHNMAAIDNLCSSCLHIFRGQIVDRGDTQSVISKYVNSYSEIAKTTSSLLTRQDRIGTGEARFRQITFLNDANEEVSGVPMGEALTIRLEYQVYESVADPLFAIFIVDQFGKTVVRAFTYESLPTPIPLSPSKPNGVLSCRFESMPLIHGNYQIHLWLGRSSTPIDYVEYAASIEITQKDVYGTGKLLDHRSGVFFTKHSWLY
ncbi:MAG: ABC transporter ATP-binding protein [Caldilineaceae bacterium]|nr:ABC transporter ATP-binding protein [Caldilineaceae bacterium]